MSTRVRVCTLAELPEGSSRVVHTDMGMVAIFHAEGGLHAIDDLCPHMRESLAQGALDGCVVTCPAHGWRFDVRTGRSPDFDGIEVETFSVDVEDDVVYLTLAPPSDDELDWEGARDPDDIDEVLFD